LACAAELLEMRQPPGRHGGDRSEATARQLAPARLPLPPVLRPRIPDCLPLDVRNRVGSAAGERDNVIPPAPWTGTASEIRGRAWMLPLEFPRHFSGSVLLRSQRARRERKDDRDNERAN
jgi:hypothetical protein